MANSTGDVEARAALLDELTASSPIREYYDLGEEGGEAAGKEAAKAAAAAVTATTPTGPRSSAYDEDSSGGSESAMGSVASARGMLG